MIITIHEDRYGGHVKVNFTDENDVFVGYDLSQACCEDAGYFICKDKYEPYSYDGNSSIDKEELEGYVFDVNFFDWVGSHDLDRGDQVCFRLIKPNSCDLFLHLYNSHNGYYSHGFEAKVGGEIWQEGGI